MKAERKGLEDYQREADQEATNAMKMLTGVLLGTALICLAWGAVVVAILIFSG